MSASSTPLIALGKAIREMREERGLTGSALAAAAEVPHWRVTALEEGRLDPDYDLLLRLADAMGTRASEFVVRAETNSGDEPCAR